MIPVRASPHWKRFEPILDRRWFQLVAVAAGSVLGVATVSAMEWASRQTVRDIVEGLVYIVRP